jgi:DNA-binding transcriptional MerR regulator
MKISEFSERSGVPLPTIKFYIREGLLPVGRRTAKNQADYTEEHLSRLALIRALKDDAGLAIGTIAGALRASDAARADNSASNFVGVAIDALRRPSGVAVDERSVEFRLAHDEIRDVAKELGWPIHASSVAHREAARALAILRRSLPHVAARPYLEAARAIATYEIPDEWRPEAAPDTWLHFAVLGTVLAEPLLLSIRRMAHVARSAEVEASAKARARRPEDTEKEPRKPSSTRRKKT